MAKIVSFSNDKGGVGKTTGNIMLAEHAAIIKKLVVLIIELDPQMNVAERYIKIEKHPISQKKQPAPHPDYNTRCSSLDIFVNVNSNASITPYPTEYNNLDIIPATKHKFDEVLEKINSETAKKNQKTLDKIASQLCAFLQQPVIQETYDLIIIDAPPANGPLAASMLNALDCLIIPAETKEMSLQGIDQFVTTWYQIALARPANRPLKLLGIIPNKVNIVRKGEKETLKSMREKSAVLKKYVTPYPIQIHERADIVDAYESRKSIFEYPDSNKTKKEMLKVFNYIHKGIFNG